MNDFKISSFLNIEIANYMQLLLKILMNHTIVSIKIPSFYLIMISIGKTNIFGKD